MALRKDKIQALKDSLCLDNVDPSTRSALNNLVDNLMDLFDDVALPEVGEFPGIDAGDFSLPEDAPFDFPTGGGEPPFFDPLDGFGGPPPGQGMGGPGGPGDPGPENQPGRDAEGGQCSVQMFVAKVVSTVYGANERDEGITLGLGLVEILHHQPVENEDNEDDDDDIEGTDEEEEDEITVDDYMSCREECRKEFWEDENDDDEFFDDDVIDGAVLEEYASCLTKCEEGKWSLQPHDPPRYLEVKNISCEKIEKDKTVLVSFDNCDLYGYVIVEACGCD